MHFEVGVFWMRRDLFVSDWHEIVILFPLQCMQFCILCRTPHITALCCKQQQQQKTPRAQQCTSSLLIPCAHGKLNVKHHRTTPKPEIHMVRTAKNVQYIFSAQVPVSPGRTVCLVEEKHHCKAHPDAERFKSFFCYECSSPLYCR